MHDFQGASHRRTAFLAAGLAALIVYGTLYPFEFSDRPSAHPLIVLLSTWNQPYGRGDLLANILLYIPLGLCCFRLFRETRPALRTAFIGAGALALSVGLELIQVYDAGRQTALGDVYANTLGALLGAAGGTLLSSHSVQFPEIRQRPVPIGIVGMWVGFRLAPFAPVIDLHKYWGAVKPVLFAPSFHPLDLFRHFAAVLAVGCILQAALESGRSRWATSALVLATLAARIVIMDLTLSPAEVWGGLVGAALWDLWLWQWRWRVRLVAGLFTFGVVLQSLDPFRFLPTAKPFSWIPFYSFLHGSTEVNIRSFFEKAFTYAALLWLTARTGVGFAAATGWCTALVLGLRVMQTYLPDRSAEITDALMVLLSAWCMKLLAEVPAKTKHPGNP